MNIKGLGISTNADTIAGSDSLLEAHLREIQAAGATYAELILHGLDVVVAGALQPSRVRAVAGVVGRVGLGHTIHLPYGLNLLDRQWGEGHRKVFEAGIDFAGVIGAELLVYHSSFRADDGSGSGAELLERDGETLRELGERAARLGVEIGVENNAWTDPSAITYGLRPSDLVDHVRGVGLDNVGMTLDLGHLHLTSAAYGWDFAGEIEATLPVLKHIHAHDNFADLSQSGTYNVDLPLGRGDLHLPMGWGTIPWPGTLELLASYEGVWMMEIEYRLAELFPEFVTEARSLLAL